MRATLIKPRDPRAAAEAAAATAALQQRNAQARAAASASQRKAWAVIGLLALVVLAVLTAWFSRSAPVAAPSPRPPVTAAVTPPSIEPAGIVRLGVAQLGVEQSSVEQLSVEQLLAGRSSDWRVARLLSNPAVLVIEFPSLREQGLTFNRAAALIEKTHGSRQQLLNDVQLTALQSRSGDNTETFYQGHDYTGPDMARFFDLARQQKTVLNGHEVRLLALMLKTGLLVEEAGVYRSEASQAVVSFSALQADNPKTKPDESVDAVRRESVLLHELSHGEFFTRADYRRRCLNFWQRGLNDAERHLFRQYLARLDYDPTNEELMVNETQALLMHTPDTRAFNADALGISEMQMTSFRQRFQQASLR